MSAIRLPNDWDPRPYQLPMWTALEQGCKRAVACWHRRSGKDDVGLHWTCIQALQVPANYWYMLPQANQARKAVWDAVDSHTGRRRIDWAFPPELRTATRDNDMMLRLKGGSTWQVVGSDNWNSLVGAPPRGIVYSEYALSDPNSWSFLRPILEENGGWALFNSTPRGRNHFHGLVQMGKSAPGWFSQILMVDDTHQISKEQIERIRRELAAERGEDEAANIINQEYYCNFDAAIPGSYYGKLIASLEALGRIAKVPYDPRLPVITGWDLGVGDSTAIWFIQQERFGSVNVIDYYENSGVGADHYAQVLKERGYLYEGHYLPHDADDREWGNNASSRIDTLKSLGVKPCRVLPRASIEDGVNAVRVLLPRCNFDAGRCERGLECLRQYQKRWDDKLKAFANAPLHDWTSHGADAFRYLAQGLRAPVSNRDSNRRFALT